jgi:hypothetical protein
LSFTKEQLDGIAALLLQKWEQERAFDVAPRPIIQIPEIQRQEWGRDLSDEQALTLIEIGLDADRWYVQELKPTAQGIKGYQYTDAETAANSPRGKYRLASF